MNGSVAIFTIISPFVLPESPMYLASTGQKSKVQDELNQVSRNSCIKDLTAIFIVSIRGFPIEIKTEIRYLIICCYHNFTL